MSSRPRTLSILAACGLLCACSGQGDRPTSFRKAQAYFAARHAELDRIVALIDTCRPIRATSDFTRLFVDRDNEGAHCRKAYDPDNYRKLMEALKAGGLVAADYSLTDDGRLASVNLGIRYAGLKASGPTTSFDYYVAPRDQPPAIRNDGSYRDLARPLTPAPRHWFWDQE